MEEKSHRWTKEEEAKLIELAPTTFYKNIAPIIGKSPLAINKKAKRMGIKILMEEDWKDFQFWNKKKDKYLLKNYDKMGITQLGKKLKVPYNHILRRLKHFGIEWETCHWKDWEIAILREMAPKCHYTEIAKMLPNRTVGAIGYKVFDLKIPTITEYRKFTKKEKTFIRKNWKIMTASAIARELKCSIGVLNRVAKELKLKGRGQKRKWDKKTLKLLRELSKTKTLEQLAKKFKTTNTAIRTIAYKNKIKLIDSKKTWSKKQEEELRQLAGTMTIDEISLKTKRPSHTIRSQAKKLGIKLINNGTSSRPWTKADYKKLKKLLLEGLSLIEISKELNRTEQALYAQIKELQLDKPNKRRVWTEDEENKLKELAKTKDVYEIAEELDRTINSVDDKARKLGVKLIGTGRASNWTPWTEEEMKKLRELGPTHTALELSKEIERTVHAINSRANEIGIKLKPSDKRWTKEQESRLIELSEDHTLNEIVLKLNKSSGSISSKAKKLGIEIISNNPNIWTKKQTEQLETLIKDHTTMEIAEIMKKTEDSVYVKAKKLGLKVKGKSRRWTKEEDELLRDMWGIYSFEYISKKLDRSMSALSNRAFVLKLGSAIANNYDGLTIKELCDLFGKTRSAISIDWVALGLTLKRKKITASSTYQIVKINDLFRFLEKNQDIWDSRTLEKNILGKEPKWLIEKRESDKMLSESHFERMIITKQQLIAARKYFLETEEEPEIKNDKPKTLKLEMKQDE